MYIFDINNDSATIYSTFGYKEAIYAMSVSRHTRTQDFHFLQRERKKERDVTHIERMFARTFSVENVSDQICHCFTPIVLWPKIEHHMMFLVPLCITYM